MVEAQQRLDTNKSKGDEQRIFRSKKILEINWERYSELAMKQDSSKDSITVSLRNLTKSFLQIILKEHEKIILKRYIENELNQEDFLKQTDYQQIKDEIFLFVYFAGHGCADMKQYYVLNEDTEDKCFWKAEANLKQLAEMAGRSLKLFVVFDTCREHIDRPKEIIRKFHAEQ